MVTTNARQTAASTHVTWPAWVSLAARLILAVVWIYAASSKLGRPLTSARAVQAYQIFPFDLAAVIGQALPILELALGLLLLVGLFTRFSAAVSALLLVLFMAGITSAWARGLQIDCGCFGGDGTLAFGREPQYMQELLRDTAFLVVAAWLLWRPQSRLSLDSWLHSRSGTPG